MITAYRPVGREPNIPTKELVRAVPFRLSALVGARMASDAGGAIHNVSSIAAVQPGAGELPYAAAKAGLNALTIGLARAYAPSVRVNCIMPGMFLTDIAEAWSPSVMEAREAAIPAGRKASGGGGRRCLVLREQRIELHDRLRVEDRWGHGISARVDVVTAVLGAPGVLRDASAPAHEARLT
jgi:NAD(P)-dependent dehydrogenase (short-subunit alcohol dehydrogenase family)